ncbi:unnamed protein product [Calypogeia fissa]
MAKVTMLVVSLVCLVVAVSSMTSCSAARWLPSSLQTDQILSSETTITTNSDSKETSVEAPVLESRKSPATYSTSMKSDEGVAGSDWEEFPEEEFGVCIDSEIVGAEGESNVEKPCHRMLSDYGNPGPNKNPKHP